MKRKIAKIGPSTLMVSIPTKWAKAHGLKKGDEIDVIENDKSLTISLGQQKTKNKLEIHIKNSSTFLNRMITRPYIAGYDEIYVTFEDPKVLDKINKALSEDYIGFTVVEQGSKHCVVKSIAEEYEEDLDRFINKAYLSLITFAKETIDLIKKKEYEKLDGLRTVYKIVVKFGHLCLRVINKKGVKNPKNIPSYYPITSTYSVVRSLMHMSNELRSMCKDLSKLKKNTKIRPETIKMYQQTVDLIAESYTLYNKQPNHEVFFKYKQKLKSMREPAHKILTKGGHPDAAIIRRLLLLRGFIYPLARYFHFSEWK